MTGLGHRLNVVFTGACRSAAEALLALSGQQDRIQDRCRVELLESAVRRHQAINADLARHLADLRTAGRDVNGSAQPECSGDLHEKALGE